MGSGPFGTIFPTIRHKQKRINHIYNKYIGKYHPE